METERDFSGPTSTFGLDRILKRIRVPQDSFIGRLLEKQPDAANSFSPSSKKSKTEPSSSSSGKKRLFSASSVGGKGENQVPPSSTPGGKVHTNQENTTFALEEPALTRRQCKIRAPVVDKNSRKRRISSEENPDVANENLNTHNGHKKIKCDDSIGSLLQEGVTHCLFEETKTKGCVGWISNEEGETCAKQILCQQKQQKSNSGTNGSGVSVTPYSTSKNAAPMGQNANPFGKQRISVQGIVDDVTAGVHHALREHERSIILPYNYELFHNEAYLTSVKRGDECLASIRRTLDEFGIKRQTTQVHFHEEMIRACLRMIYQYDYEQNIDRVLRENNWPKMVQELMVITARRMGKTTAVAIFAAAMLICVPNLELMIFRYFLLFLTSFTMLIIVKTQCFAE